MEKKLIQMVACERPFLVGGERIEPGSTFEASAADAFVLVRLRRANFVNPRDVVYAIDAAGAPARDRSDRPMFGPGPAGMQPDLPMPRGEPLRI